MSTSPLYISLLLFTLTVSQSVNAQKDSTGILQFNVKGVKSKFAIFPRDNFFFSECKNRIKIIPLTKIKNYEVKCDNGKLTKRNDSIYVIENLIGDVALITVYEVLANGKKKAAMNKEYRVVNYPIAVLNGIQCDSAITKPILCGGRLYVRYKKYTVDAEVISFKMEMNKDSKPYVDGQPLKDLITTDSSATNKLNPKMREYVRNIKGGEVIYLRDIKYKSPDGTIMTEPILRFFLVEDGSYRYLGF